MDYVLLGSLAIWAVFSIFAQCRGSRLYRWVKYPDYCAMLPSWSFFAPNPGVTDFQLLYRNRLLDGTYTDWKAVKFDAPTWRRWFWHPEKRLKKFLHDWASHLQDFAARVKDERTFTHLGYILLLGYATRQPQAFDADRVQFMVARSDGFTWEKEPRVMIVSGLHALSESEADSIDEMVLEEVQVP